MDAVTWVRAQDLLIRLGGLADDFRDLLEGVALRPILNGPEGARVVDAWMLLREAGA